MILFLYNFLLNISSTVSMICIIKIHDFLTNQIKTNDDRRKRGNELKMESSFAIGDYEGVCQGATAMQFDARQASLVARSCFYLKRPLPDLSGFPFLEASMKALVDSSLISAALQMESNSKDQSEREQGALLLALSNFSCGFYSEAYRLAAPLAVIEAYVFISN